MTFDQASKLFLTAKGKLYMRRKTWDTWYSKYRFILYRPKTDCYAINQWHPECNVRAEIGSEFCDLREELSLGRLPLCHCDFVATDWILSTNMFFTEDSLVSVEAIEASVSSAPSDTGCSYCRYYKMAKTMAPLEFALHIS